MTSDNLTYSVEIDFIPDIEEGRDDFKKKMKTTAEKYNATFAPDTKGRPVISGLSQKDAEGVLLDLGLLAFGLWPKCILTCTIATPLPIRTVGMSDGWDIYTGKKTFFAFAQFPADAISIVSKACTYYLDHENFESLDEFIARVGYESYRDAVLGNTMPDGSTPGLTASSYAPNVPPLAEGDFVKPEHNVMQVIEVYPEMGQFLMEYGLSCVGCFVSYDENLWQAAQVHGMDVFELIGEMNEYIADKYKKPLLTEETPIEEILTHYPQLLTIFQSANLKMPDDMHTPIGKMCEEAGVDFAPFIEKCNARLRGGESIR